MLKQILGRWNPGWKQARWKATLIAMPIICLCVPLLFLALPYLEILNDMAVQPKGKAQGHYGWFSDQIIPVERAAVAGTVPMGVDPPYALEYVVTEKDEEKAAVYAGKTLVNPIAKPTRADMRRGAEIFGRICWTCHGKQADGDGPIVGPDWFPAPPSLHTPQANGYPDGRIWHVMTRGQNKMPSYADTLTPLERWQVVHFVRALQLAKKKAN